MTRLVLAALAVVGVALFMLGRRASGPAPADPTDSAGDGDWAVEPAGVELHHIPATEGYWHDTFTGDLGMWSTWVPTKVMRGN